MSLALHVDAERWRTHLDDTLDVIPALVPVIKGNGYGFGLQRLTREAAALRVDTVAVGDPAEIRTVRAGYQRDILVLAPWRPEWKDDFPY